MSKKQLIEWSLSSNHSYKVRAIALVQKKGGDHIMPLLVDDLDGTPAIIITSVVSASFNGGKK